MPLHEFAWSVDTDKAGLRRDAMYLVRPDAYVAMVAADEDAGGLREHVAKFKINTR